MTIGKKILDFVFTNPTESMVGLPPSKEKLTKDLAIEKIEEAWDHPFSPNHQHDLPPVQNKKEEREKVVHKTLGERIKAFLFEIPHGESLGDKKKMSKKEALEIIDRAWEHPFNSNVAERPAAKEVAEKESHDHRSFTETIKHLAVDRPTEADLGLPPPTKDLTEKEKMKAIQDVWKHPFAPQPAH